MSDDRKYKVEVKLSGLGGAENAGLSLFFFFMAIAALYILFAGDPDGIDAIRKILFDYANLKGE
jgi:hypothetical protein